MSERIRSLGKPFVEKEAVPTRKPLTFTEGFNFGLGFWIAGFLFLVFGVPIFTILAVIALAILGVSLGGN